MRLRVRKDMRRKPYRIIVASDSFKGSLTSQEVAEAAGRGLRSAMPDAEIVAFAIGDGGEGTAHAITTALGGRWIIIPTESPDGTPLEAGYGIAAPSGDETAPTAIIDVASASGLTLVGAGSDIMNRSSRGTGIMIADALARGCRRFIIGLGGSATCDGGIGMLSALGIDFLDASGNELPPVASSLALVESVDMRKVGRDILTCEFIVMNDVANPLCGAEGAACVFAPQKGATAAQVKSLDSGLSRLYAIVAKTTGRDVAAASGAGAAGGIGAALMAFFRCEMCTGAEAMLDIVKFDEALPGTDMIITGEGRLDRQTMYGKLPLGVLRRGERAGIPVVAIGGSVENVEELRAGGFAEVYEVTPKGMCLSRAMERDVAAANVEMVCRGIVQSVELPFRINDAVGIGG